MLFQKLHADRLENDKVLQKDSMRGVKKSVVEKYSDIAHFIYELLQNADDVGATRADFELFADKLIFKHNGTRHFSISDPATEKADRLSDKLGDINAITSIGNSNKEISPATIGKFGVGFKAVFQYTETPEIWDTEFSFRIEHLIVPVLLEGECPYSKEPEETLFVFPFNRQDMPKDKAYSDIKEKLQKKLSFPLLFLSHLQELTFKIGEFQGFYKKNIISTTPHNDITEEKIQLLENTTGTDTEWNFLFFSRQHSSGKYFIGYYIENGKLKPITRTAFCFFPTKEVTDLKFIIHAPFLLTDSRESILSGNTHNQEMIELLAKLAADSLPILRDQNLIDDDIVEIIPVTEGNNSLFSPFYEKIKEAMKTQELIPAFDSAKKKFFV